MILQFCFNADLSYRKNAKSAKKFVLWALFKTKEPVNSVFPIGKKTFSTKKEPFSPEREEGSFRLLTGKACLLFL
ncbi:hypothetical protein FTE28_13585 [Bacillus licheniformis]|jgi:hypothetical protein|nr:hypothetical protein AB684_18810 [Bacillus licheniformis]APJ28624.1 hypothetical protein BSZ43_18565 [Bacillus sp. H15-1]ASV17076.1 hypothetical protein CJO35_18725 [Bacillus sp. 1s-1]EQM26373.1 hypothetical protein N399_20525 [Bacillus licheniformis CG-B52]KUL12092.1 hypothetical protein LI17339_06555 [Bacillus licheniformis LMG 17339]MBY8348155.1 hypothetical protein [Bacillus sp. PCH94]NJE36075.1 hypothetical protein [Bacillus paralicheniformis]